MRRSDRARSRVARPLFVRTDARDGHDHATRAGSTGANAAAGSGLLSPPRCDPGRAVVRLLRTPRCARVCTLQTLYPVGGTDGRSCHVPAARRHGGDAWGRPDAGRVPWVRRVVPPASPTLTPRHHQIAPSGD
jgi:hypothetical protein